MVQLELSTYKGNLFEYFHFIRNKKDVLNELVTIASSLETADSLEKQKQLPRSIDTAIRIFTVNLLHTAP
jgi:hypothetical protein